MSVPAAADRASRPPVERMRVDKWLFVARFFRTRSLAAALVAGGHLRVNGRRAPKPAQGVAPGDVLTFAQGGRIRVVRITALSPRRGPAPEAQALYEDLDPSAAPGASELAAQGRPSGPEP